MTIGKMFAEGFPFKFPGGETQVRVNTDFRQSLNPYAPVVTFTKKVRSGDDIMEILLTVDALRRSGCKRLKLRLPYVPYGRQDRGMVPGEALGIKVFADLLNSCNFEEVEIWDPHSDVTTALINNVRVVGQEELIIETCWPNHTVLSEGRVPFKDTILVCPDAGARKKILKVASKLDKTEILFADKIRDPATGQITGTKVDWSGITKSSENMLIVDDICDGGKTFVEIAKEIKKTVRSTFPLSLHLYITHGFFSKGLDELAQYFQGIYVANLMSQDPAVINHPLLKGNKKHGYGY